MKSTCLSFMMRLQSPIYKSIQPPRPFTNSRNYLQPYKCATQQMLKREPLPATKKQSALARFCWLGKGLIILAAVVNRFLHLPFNFFRWNIIRSATI